MLKVDIPMMPQKETIQEFCLNYIPLLSFFVLSHYNHKVQGILFEFYVVKYLDQSTIPSDLDWLLCPH